MSVLKVAVASVLALSMVLGLALPALADSGESLPWTEEFQVRIVKGTVTEVDKENQVYFKVQSREDEIDIRVDENTRYFILNKPGRIVPLLQQFRLQTQAEVGTPDEPGLKFRVQNRVAQTESTPLVEPQLSVPRPFGQAGFSDIEIGDRVMVWLADVGNLAKWVLIIKPAVRAHVGGVITGLSSDTIEITPEDGRSVTLRYDQDTVFVLSGFTSVVEGQLARTVYEREHMLAKKVAVHLPD